MRFWADFGGIMSFPQFPCRPRRFEINSAPRCKGLNWHPRHGILVKRHQILNRLWENASGRKNPGRMTFRVFTHRQMPLIQNIRRLFSKILFQLHRICGWVSHGRRANPDAVKVRCAKTCSDRNVADSLEKSVRMGVEPVSWILPATDSRKCTIRRVIRVWEGISCQGHDLWGMVSQTIFRIERFRKIDGQTKIAVGSLWGFAQYISIVWSNYPVNLAQKYCLDFTQRSWGNWFRSNDLDCRCWFVLCNADKHSIPSPEPKSNVLRRWLQR